MTADLQGVWQLSRWSVTHHETESVYYPFSGAPEGYLIYSADGWVTANLMQRERSPVCEDRLQLRKMCATPPVDVGEIEPVWQWFLAGYGYVAYCGRFEVTQNRVHHHVQTSLIPQWVGTTLTRDMEWYSDKQELHLLAAGDELSDRLEWKRVREV